MRLYFAPTSPFARKARVALRELDLLDLIEEVEINPWTDGRLRALNPLAKVPTLEADDGEVLFESSLICEFLDDRAKGGLFPPAGVVRWRSLRLEAIADGIALAAGRLYADEQRPETERSQAVMARQADAIEAGLDALETGSGELSQAAWTIAEIAAASALLYLDFRFPDRDWRAAHPRLAAWCTAIADRPSIAATRFHLPEGR